MGDWPSGAGGNRIVSVGEVAASSRGTAITSSGANTKGSWVQLTASTPCASAGLVLSISARTALATYLLDVGVGAAGSEVPIISNLHFCGGAASTESAFPALFPIVIPAGARLSVRMQADATSEVAWVLGHLIAQTGPARPGRSRVVTYGAATGTSRGTSVDPGGSANTKGSWVQLSASTSSPIRELLIGAGGQLNTAAALASWLVDVGVGAAGSEVVLIPNHGLITNVSEMTKPEISTAFPVSIPESSRLAVRSQCSITDATDRLLDFVLYGVT